MARSRRWRTRRRIIRFFESRRLSHVFLARLIHGVADVAEAKKEKHFSSTARWVIDKGMKQFTAIIHRGEPDEGGFWATCLEVPGANGQGETREECLANLKDAIQLLLDTGREEAFRLDPQAETAELLLA